MGNDGGEKVSHLHLFVQTLSAGHPLPSQTSPASIILFPQTGDVFDFN